MDVLLAMGRLAKPLEAKMQQYPSDVLDGILELETLQAQEEAVAWLAFEHGLVELINEGDVVGEQLAA